MTFPALDPLPLPVATRLPHRHRNRRGPCPRSADVDVLVGRRLLAHHFSAYANIGKLIRRLPLRAVALHGAIRSPGIIGKPAVVNVAWPWMNGVGDGVGLLGVAGAHGDGIGALEIAIHLVVTGQAV